MAPVITAQYRDVASFFLDEPETALIVLENKAFLLFGSNKLLNSVIWAGEPWLDEAFVICDKGYLIGTEDQQADWAIDVMQTGMPCADFRADHAGGSVGQRTLLCKGVKGKG